MGVEIKLNNRKYALIELKHSKNTTIDFLKSNKSLIHTNGEII